MNDYISLEDSAELCGVSPGTLDRFIETGHLRVTAGAGKARMLSRGELSRVFGLSETLNTQSVSMQPLRNTVTVESTFDREPVLEKEPEDHSPAPRSHLSIVPEDKSDNPAAPDETFLLREEVSKYRSISEIQEKILEIRETEIKDLKEERLWLRERIEKLEESSNRNQLLLLAEAEMVRQMVERRKRSPIRLALEWVGLADPEIKPGDTINVTPGSSGKQ